MRSESRNNGVAFAGVDIGSLTAKAIILINGQVVGQALIPTSISSEKSGFSALEKALEAAKLSRSELQSVLATGYGRISAPYADKTITEITCHASGASNINPNARTIIDMGGQDCKAIRLDEEGNVTDFTLNDKCAAGTGRFLEVMSKAFDIGLDELGPLSLKATYNVAMSSTCTVFAESEVVSLMARGEKPENILSGIHHAIANRIAGMFARTGVEDEIFFSGGVAKNSGMRKALEEVLGKKIVSSKEDPQLVGALGAALIAQERSLRR
jgi:predicted CoA-substrate-specific enzyme activase